jgi:hypothetical protein
MGKGYGLRNDEENAMPTIRVFIDRNDDATYKDAVPKLGADESLTLVREENENIPIAYFREGYFISFETVEHKVDRYAGEGIDL